MQTLTVSEKSTSSTAAFTHKSKQPFFAPARVQPKLSIGAVDDPYEREADAMADKVMRMQDRNSQQETFFKPVQNRIQRQAPATGETTEPTHEGTPGDVLKAVTAIPQVNLFLENLGQQFMLTLGRTWDDPTHLGKIGLFATGGSLLAGLGLSVFAARNNPEALDLMSSPLSGTVFRLPASLTDAPLPLRALGLEANFDRPSPLSPLRNNMVGVHLDVGLLLQSWAPGLGFGRADSMSGIGAPPSSAFTISRKCSKCEEEDKLQRKNNNSSLEKKIDGPEFENYVSGLGSSGIPLSRETLGFFEPRMGYDFSNVKIHTDSVAAKSAGSINALAYTSGNNIVFNQNQYSPETESGKSLLAHELTHVVQQNHDINRKYTAGLTEEPEEQVGIGGLIQRDLAVEPPNPMEATVILTDAQMRNAIRWNQRRFHDPFNIMNVRDVIGIEKYPAVIDEDFVNAVLRWQAGQGLEQDGKFGATSTRTVVGELTAAGSEHAAETLALDNTVDTVDILPQTYNTCAPGLPFEFDWRVGFRTTLRNGFIIQKIDNVFNAAMCGGGAYTGWKPVPHYWEAWRVDGNGNVIPALGGVNDMFTRPLLPNSSGNWSMVGTLYTTRTLPASFVLNSVPDAGNLLRSTLNDPGSDFLGYVAARRRVGGTWNCCAAPPTHVRS